MLVSCLQAPPAKHTSIPALCPLHCPSLAQAPASLARTATVAPTTATACALSPCHPSFLWQREGSCEDQGGPIPSLSATAVAKSSPRPLPHPPSSPLTALGHPGLAVPPSRPDRCASPRPPSLPSCNSRPPCHFQGTSPRPCWGLYTRVSMPRPCAIPMPALTPSHRLYLSLTLLVCCQSPPPRMSAPRGQVSVSLAVSPVLRQRLVHGRLPADASEQMNGEVSACCPEGQGPG